MFPGAALAQSEYPTRPIKLIVGFAPGGSTTSLVELLRRSWASGLAKPSSLKTGPARRHDRCRRHGQGAGRRLHADARYDQHARDCRRGIFEVAVQPCDGLHTDFAGGNHALSVGGQSASTGAQLERIPCAREEPARQAELRLGRKRHSDTPRDGDAEDAAKIDVVHIPYKGNAPADAAILAGDVQAVFGSMPALLQNAKANKVRPLAVGTATRSPALPDVPTVAEQGYPGFEAALWLGIMGPANMPKPGWPSRRRSARGS